jgi:glycosyltransferase involved in cell wall biosynthesis
MNLPQYRGRSRLHNTNSTAPRILIVWYWLPCFHLGAGILMRRLFAGYPRDRLWALTSLQSTRQAAPFDPVPSPDRQMSVPEIQIRRRWLDKLALLLNRLLIPWMVWRGVRLVRKEKIQVIFTVPWDHFTISAYFIHKITGRPIYMYIMDDPVGRRRFGGLQPVAYALLMPRIVRACKRVWGVSDGMCEYFEKAYGAKCLPLLPLVDVQSFGRKSANHPVRADDSFHIVYTGSIYGAQLDAVRRLVQVVNQESDRTGNAQVKIRLTLYTSVSAGWLEEMGLSGKNIRRDEVRSEDIPSVIAEADVAFLPFSFESHMRHIVETSIPSKIAEYLASGIPILAHAPSYSTVARYCRKYDCGLVVGQPDEDALRVALLRLKSDPALRRKLSTKALEAARENHDASRIAPAFLRQMESRTAV